MSATERVSTAKLVLLEGEDNPALDQERPLTLRRPCECGCDQRGNPTLVGYVNCITKGSGFTLEIHDEGTYQHMTRALAGKAAFVQR